MRRCFLLLHVFILHSSAVALKPQNANKDSHEFVIDSGGNVASDGTPQLTNRFGAGVLEEFVAPLNRSRTLIRAEITRIAREIGDLKDGYQNTTGDAEEDLETKWRWWLIFVAVGASIPVCVCCIFLLFAFSSSSSMSREALNSIPESHQDHRNREIRAGYTVKFVNLTSQPSFNNTKGIVKDFDSTTMRWIITPSDSSTNLKLLGMNLEVVSR